MSYKIKEIVGSLEHTELVKIQDDLRSGGIHLNKLVSEEIKKNENAHEKTCSTCQNKIQPEDLNNFTLVFGPDSFKKKASFCALDCLQYFINTLKRIREVR